MADKKRRSALDRFLELPPPYPSLSPDIEIGPEGRAVVDTSNGVDEVYFFSCHPLSFNGTLSDKAGNDERIDDYVHQFLIDRAKCRPKAKAKDVQEDADGIEAEAGSSSTEEHDSSSDDSAHDEQPDNIFDSQARTWRTVLKRREHAAIQYTIEALLTHELINPEAWQTHLLINATIRKIIYSLEGRSTPPQLFGAASLFILRDSRHTPPFHPPIICAHPCCPLPSCSITAAGTAYISLESVTALALNRSSNGSLLASPGVQVTDNVFIPVFIRPAREAFPSPFTRPKGNGSTSNSRNAYGFDYRAPVTAIGKHPLTTAAAGYYHAPEEVNGNAEDGEDISNITVHASFCISCLRNLYASAVTPEITTEDTTQNFTSANSDGEHCQPATSKEESSAEAQRDPVPEEQARDKMTGVVETGSGGDSSGGSGGWSAVNMMKMKGDEPQGRNGGGGNKRQPQSPAFGIPQLDGVSDPQSDGSGGGIATGGIGCAVM